MSCFNLPQDKCFQQFIALNPEDFIYPNDRSEHYTIIEISMFEGRNDTHKKQLIKTIFHHIEHQCGISPQDIEITLFETPRSHWGIRGQSADELKLNYVVHLE